MDELLIKLITFTTVFFFKFQYILSPLEYNSYPKILTMDCAREFNNLVKYSSNLSRR